jgi:predicted nucleic acid-binding protein
MGPAAIATRRRSGISKAFDLARHARSAGISVPATDILIAACARHHQCELEHADADFSLLDEL